MSTTTVIETRAEPITAQTILSLFPDIDTSGEALEGHDEEQIRLMDEVCIVLDENDVPIGTASKKLCMCSTFAWGIQKDTRMGARRRVAAKTRKTMGLGASRIVRVTNHARYWQAIS